MFEFQNLIGSPRRSLRLDTRVGNPIENEIAAEPSQRHVDDYEHTRRPQWTQRKLACGIYNCHGHVFAARRTAIYSDHEINKLLVEDGYRELADGENPAPDDIVLYRHNMMGIVHVARVLEVKPIEDGGGAMFISRLVSKWNDISGEDLHTLTEVAEAYHSTHVYTDRPA